VSTSTDHVPRRPRVPRFWRGYTLHDRLGGEGDACFAGHANSTAAAREWLVGMGARDAAWCARARADARRDEASFRTLDVVLNAVPTCYVEVAAGPDRGRRLSLAGTEAHFDTYAGHAAAERGE